MTAQRALVAQRVAAQHCAELLRSGQAPFDLDAACAEFAAELALGLPDALHPLLIGARPTAVPAPVDDVAASALVSSWSAPSIHYAVACGDEPVLFALSFGNTAALGLTDRMFGGAGTEADDPPANLPHSAVMAMERVVRAVAAAIAPLCGGDEAAPDVEANPVLRRLGVFKRNERALRFAFTIDQTGRAPWTLHLSVPLAALRPVLENRAAGAPKRAANSRHDPLDGAMAAIPLPMVAVLAELSLPLSRFAQLRPGDCIPFSPRRDVPLTIGSRVVASGAVGAFDERSALRLTRLT